MSEYICILHWTSIELIYRMDGQMDGQFTLFVLSGSFNFVVLFSEPLPSSTRHHRGTTRISLEFGYYATSTHRPIRSFEFRTWQLRLAEREAAEYRNELRVRSRGQRRSRQGRNSRQRSTSGRRRETVIKLFYLAAVTRNGYQRM